LEDADKYIQLAQSILIASSENDGYANPLPYNKTVNEWFRTHRSEVKEEFEELPELNSDVANVFKQSLNNYSTEIDSWIRRARNN